MVASLTVHGLATERSLRHTGGMAQRAGWTRDQQLLALRLYMRTRFGRLHGRNPDIIRLAEMICRTPNALAMKACNFASLDPAFRQTNRRGLTGASLADRAIWVEFADNSEALAAEAEEAFARLGPDVAAEGDADITIPLGETDVARVVRARRVQSFFRAAVITSYGCRCAISGIPVPELLVASHIIPWSQSIERRADPTNGLCLNALFDRAFDRGFITIGTDGRVIVSKHLKSAAESSALACSLNEADGRELMVPDRFPPAAIALEYHRRQVFRE
jgi:putative restriction endonuclease